MLNVGQIRSQTERQSILPDEHDHRMATNGALLAQAVHLFVRLGLDVDHRGVCLEQLAQVGADGLLQATGHVIDLLHNIASQSLPANSCHPCWWPRKALITTESALQSEFHRALINRTRLVGGQLGLLRNDGAVNVAQHVAALLHEPHLRGVSAAAHTMW